MITDYLRFRWKSVNAHGLHSPFMYHLATRCFYDKTKYPDYQKLKLYHHELIRNKQIIEVEDLGAGSRKFKSQYRKISAIAQISGSNINDMKRYYRLVRYFKPDNILELGTSLGKATYAMALGNPNANIITVEGAEQLAHISEKLLKNKNIKAKIINQNFDDYLKQLNLTEIKFDFILIDGNHRLQPTLTYFEKLQKHIHNDTVVIIDDIYWSNEMKHAWQQLIKHPNVRQSVDTFHFGMLFFRKEQFKQDFIIRY